MTSKVVNKKKVKQNLEKYKTEGINLVDDNNDDNNKDYIKIKENNEITINSTNNNLNTNVILIKDKYPKAKFDFKKPFLKWVGGKTQIITNIINQFPIEMDNYHEIFLGGGSVLFAVLTLQKDNKINIKNKIYAYDYNQPLIYVYKNLQTKPKKFISKIKVLIDEYVDIDGEIKNLNPKNKEEALGSKESYYYWIRSLYNSMDENEKLSSLGSAYFVFLNKTCFRGVFRMNKVKKEFNVPFGHYENPLIIDEEHIKEISNLIKNVEFIHESFEESIKKVKKNDYVYLDPIYYKLVKNSFVDYTSDGFSQETHDKLFDMLHELKKQDIKWMMSNSSAEYVIQCFNDTKKYSTEKILCRRAINSKNPESTVDEVIIKSY